MRGSFRIGGFDPPIADFPPVVQCLVEIGVVKPHDAVVNRALIHADDGKLHAAWINAAEKRELLPDVHFLLFESIAPDDAGGAVFDPRFVLILRDADFTEDFSELARVHRELRPHERLVFLEFSAEPCERHDGFDSGDFFDDGKLARGKRIGEGQFVADGDAERGAAVVGRLGQLTQNDHERDEQKHADGDAEHAEQQSAFVAKRVADEEAGDRHGETLRHIEQPPLFQMNRLRAVARGARIVRDHDDGLARFAAERAQDFQNSLGARAVEVASGFVGDDEFRVRDDGARDGDTLLLPAGHLFRQMPRAVGEPDEFERGEDEFFSPCAVQVHEQKRKLHVFVSSKNGDEIEALKNKTDVLIPPVGELRIVQLRDTHTTDATLAGCRSVNTCDNVQKRAFSRTGRAHE